MSDSSCLLHESRTNIIVRMVELSHGSAGRVSMREEIDRPRRPPTQQLNSMQLLSLNEAGTCAVAVVLLCTRSAVAHVQSSMTDALSTAAHSVSDIVCVASVNALLQNMISGEDLSSPFERFLLVSVVAVMACTIQKLLSDGHFERYI